MARMDRLTTFSLDAWGNSRTVHRTHMEVPTPYLNSIIIENAQKIADHLRLAKYMQKEVDNTSPIRYK